MLTTFGAVIGTRLWYTGSGDSRVKARAVATLSGLTVFVSMFMLTMMLTNGFWD